MPQTPHPGATPQPAARCPETPESAFGFDRNHCSDSIGILSRRPGPARNAAAGRQTDPWRLDPDTVTTQRQLDHWTSKADRRAQEEAELEAREMRAGSTGREGDPAGAKDQFAVLLPVRERVSGAEHPYALAARHNLAFWTGQAGDAAGARDQFAALLPVRERVSGAEDPATLNVRSNLAFWTGQAGDAAGARDQLAALLPVRKRLSGGGIRRHWRPGGSSPAGPGKQAMRPPPGTSSQRCCRSSNGPSAPSTPTPGPDSANLTTGPARPIAGRRRRPSWKPGKCEPVPPGGEGDPAGARDQFAVLLPVRERVSGAEHPYALAARHNLAFWTGQAGDAAGARDQFAALLPVRERVSGAEDPATLNVRSNLAFWAGQAGDAAGARDQLAALLPVRKRLSGGGHPETLATRRELARWTGEAGDAAAARDQSPRCCRSSNGPSAPSTPTQ